MQRWHLHLALITLAAVGGQPRRQIGGFMLAAAFLPPLGYLLMGMVFGV